MSGGNPWGAERRGTRRAEGFSRLAGKRRHQRLGGIFRRAGERAEAGDEEARPIRFGHPEPLNLTLEGRSKFESAAERTSGGGLETRRRPPPEARDRFAPRSSTSPQGGG